MTNYIELLQGELSFPSFCLYQCSENANMVSNSLLLNNKNMVVEIVISKTNKSFVFFLDMSGA